MEGPLPQEAGGKMCDKRDNKITRWLALCISLLLFSCDPLSAQSGLAKESPNSIRELNEQTDSQELGG